MTFSDIKIADDETYVCKEHFSDPSIIKFIEEENFEYGVCSYCSNSTCKVIAFDMLITFLHNGIKRFFGHPDEECLEYDSEDGGWQNTEIFDSRELFDSEISIDVDNEDLSEDIVNSFGGKEWCRVEPHFQAEDHALRTSWGKYCEIVKHEMRYSFLNKDNLKTSHHKEFSNILLEVAHGVESLDLLKVLEIDTILYRGRQHGTETPITSINQLSSPPKQFTNFPNRMSPAGISMFYGAFDKATAINEIIDNKALDEKPLITIGEFSLKVALNVIDFTEEKEVPSIFDKNRSKHYYLSLFFSSFVGDLAKNIARDDRVHVEYIPTQVLTEFFRFVYPGLIGTEVDGILYRSSKSEGGKCCVLFFDNTTSLEIFELAEISLIEDPAAKGIDCPASKY